MKIFSKGNNFDSKGGQLAYDAVMIVCGKSFSNEAFGCRAQTGDEYLGVDPGISCLGGLLSAQIEVFSEKSEKDSI